MKKKQWILLFVIIVIVIAVLLILAFSKSKAEKEKRKEGEKCPDGSPIPATGACPQSTSTSSTPISSGSNSGCVPPSSYSFAQFPIKLGMKDGGAIGLRVSQLQKSLNKKYNAGLKDDGFFGCNTLGAVRQYLKVDEVTTTNPIWAVQL